MPKVLLIDDEEKFRQSLAKRLEMRGLEVVQATCGDDAIKLIRQDASIDVALLDRKMPGMSGEQTLKELKNFRPAMQIIMLTAHGSLASAKEAGKLDAFDYMEKPVEDLDFLIGRIEAAREEHGYAMERLEVVKTERSSLWKWLMGQHNSRPLFILVGILAFAAVVFMPTPQRMKELLTVPKTPRIENAAVDMNMGYSEYRKMSDGENIVHYYAKKNSLYTEKDGKKDLLNPEQVFTRAKVMLGVIVIAALFWATGAVPVGVTALIVGVIMICFNVLDPDKVAQAYAKDAVVFIFGVLAMSKAISRTGLDRRIGLLLLSPAKNLTLLLLVFMPTLSMTCSFISEHALVAFIMPIFVMVYASSCRAAGIKKDKALMVLFALAVCYAANTGGPGSPAAGGRNAIMIGILADYNLAPSFGEWVKYGFPMVPVMSLSIAIYLLVAVRPKVQVKQLNASKMVKQSAEKIGKMNRDEYVTAAILLIVIFLWIFASDSLGMGGPVILGLVLMNIFRVLPWREMAKIHWEVVFLYAGASAIGKGLATTGAALVMADTFVNILPPIMQEGSGLAIAASIFTGLATNFMSDGATVAAIGPITVPMAQIAGTHPWMVGFATAFASSFAHMLIIGTPSNALAYAMAKDPVTGEQLVTLADFFKHGFFVLLISFVVLWVWVILGYWQWIGFPS